MTFRSITRPLTPVPALAALVILLVGCATSLRKAERLANTGDTAAARSVLLEALAKDSTNATLWQVLGILEDTTGHPREAMAAYQHLLRLQPDSREARQSLARVYLVLADSQFARGNRPAARDTLELALKIDSTCAVCWERLGDVYMAIDYVRSARRYYAKAVAAGNAAATTKLDSATKRIAKARQFGIRGQKLYARGRWTSASKLLERAAAFDAENDTITYWLHMSKGRRLYKKGSIKALWAAISEFGHAAALRPDAAEPHYWLARAYHKKDRNEFVNAIEEYQKAAELEPNSKIGKLSARKARELKAWKKKLDDFWGRKR